MPWGELLAAPSGRFNDARANAPAGKTIIPYASAYKSLQYAIPYNVIKYAFAYDAGMEIIARTPRQLGIAVQRRRKEQNLTQGELGFRMNARQATVSKLEKGEPATQLQTLMNSLAALGLELVVRPRTTSRVEELEELF